MPWSRSGQGQGSQQWLHESAPGWMTLIAPCPESLLPIQEEATAAWEGGTCSFHSGLSGMVSIPSLWWPHESSVGRAEWHGGGVSLDSGGTGLFQAENKFLLLQNYFYASTLLPKLPQGLTNICE